MRAPLYLSGAVRPEFLGRSDRGVILTPYMGNRPDLSRTPWAADTGCFTRSDFTLPKYLRWLRHLERYRETCLFVTAPDVPFNAEATLERTYAALGRLEETGLPLALITQDGMEHLEFPLSPFQALFVGGTTVWKTSEPSLSLVTRAHERGLWTHMGRVNSKRRYDVAHAAGCDSVDGTFVRFGGAHNVARLDRWLAFAAQQGCLSLRAQE